MTIVVVGKNGLMGTEMQRHFSGTEWLFLSHSEALADTTWTKTARCLINFAFSPALRVNDYDENEDIDSRLASLTQPHTHYIMMSSRTVYGPAPIDSCLRESDKPAPQTPYAHNKLHIEQRLTDQLKDRLTVLRGANVFGHEAGRKSFFGMALASLKNKGQIVFDMDPAVKRDFLAVWHVADALGRIAASPKPGLYNLGSGYGTPCRDIASWLIEGYGSGEMVSTSDELRDDFYLDMTKTKTAFKLPAVTPAMMRQDCVDCGRALTGWHP